MEPCEAWAEAATSFSLAFSCADRVRCCVTHSCGRASSKQPGHRLMGRLVQSLHAGLPSLWGAGAPPTPGPTPPCSQLLAPPPPFGPSLPPHLHQLRDRLCGIALDARDLDLLRLLKGTHVVCGRCGRGRRLPLGGRQLCMG